MIGRAALVALATLSIAAVIVANAAVDTWSDSNPRRAATVWPLHPDVELSLGMTEIAEAARDRRQVGEGIFKMVDDAATKAPLAPEPFLVRGVQADAAGDRVTAAHAFLAAQRRDPRSLPAAYFLAEHYFKGGE